ncbi:syntaxin-like protein [Pisolithus orientalis]|uniref:syntaxin-like protein n=1 Tax=Pisolithus orientalis TaxID=936130 RepID=UPI0022247F17|nr:syntaxin-like protein [Pisolithus orientalis]KAI6032644.1 syntaxin-like protein [Pisolithus orientalis]
MSSTAKLTAITTSTLSLLLERQRLQTTHPTLHLQQIVSNLRVLRAGVIEAQSQGDDDADAGPLRGQYERLIEMLGEEEAKRANLESIPPPAPPSPSLPSSPSFGERKMSPEPLYEPYTDDPDPEPALGECGILLQQRRIIDDQDTHLEHLSSSIGRQHHISLQINDELEVHTGLLDTLDTELDGTDARMRNARRRLGRVARGAKENGSTVIIVLLILVLLILIVIFKT